MNNFFTIPELVNEICLQCDKHTLATLSRTARLFDCALDALWSGFHGEVRRISLDALIQCFPRETWTCSQDGDFSLLKAIEPQHWDRFNFYAMRVKVFHLDMSKFDTALLTSLVGNKPPGNILPRLEHLSLYAHVENQLLHAHAFLPPNLQILDIELLPQQISGSILVSLFQTVPTICTNLSNLTIRISHAAYLPALPTLLGHLRNLRRLLLYSIATEYLPLITSLPGLTHLTIYSIMDRNAISPPVSTFASDTLMFLDLSGGPKQICALFNLLSQSPLEYLSVGILDSREASEFAEVVRAVTDKCQPSSLHRVNITEDSDQRFKIAGEHLAPFLTFPNITHFEHDHCSTLHLDDSFILSLATSWPKLERLYLTSGFYGLQPYTPIVTAKSFVSLAFHCPRLSFVGLEFDATTITSVLSKDVSNCPDDKPRSFDIQEVCNRPVLSLDIRYSPIAEPAPVAEFLCAIFPNLTELRFHPPFFMDYEASKEYTEQWQRVRIGLELENSTEF